MIRGAHRPSAALVVACVALLVSLGGTSVAAVSQLLPKNSVGTAQLRSDAVVSAKVKNRSLLAVDFARGQLPRGPRGPKGDKGDAGAPGTSGYEVVTASNKVTKQFVNSATATCPPGKTVLGGGGQITQGATSAADGPFLYRSFPVGTSGWTVAEVRSPAGTWTLTAYAVCAAVAG